MKLITFRDINKEIKSSGFHYSIKDFTKNMLVLLGATTVAGVFFNINIVFILACLVFCVVLLPYMYGAQFHYLYEAKRFEDCTLYMTQIISSFKKTKKILPALKETREVVDDEIGEYIDEAIRYLEEGDFDQNIYREALSIIEEKYGCSRMKSLHDFLAKIESDGGEFEKALNVLNNDIEDWTTRVYQYQKDRRNIKSKIVIAIFLAFIISASTKLMVPEQLDFTSGIPYQVVTMGTIMLMVLFYALVQSKITGAWLDIDKVGREKKIDADYKILESYDVRAGKTKALPIVLAMLAAAIYFIIKQDWLKAALGLFGMYYFYNMPNNKKKFAKRRLEREIQKAFPDWLRALSIALQTKTVRVAIAESIDEAPYILQPYIAEMTEKFERDLSITPYVEFLKDFDIKEVNSAMRSLYAFNNTDKDDTETQLNTLIKRNNELLARSEKLKNEDTTGALGFLVTMPMVIGSIKMVADMFLMFISFMSSISF